MGRDFGLIRSCGEEVCGRSSGKKIPGLESWWWNEETEKAVREKEDRLNMWKRTGEDDDRNEYKRAKGAAKKVVARVKAEAIEELYANLETSEGQKGIYRIAAARDRAGKDIGHNYANHQERNGRCIDERRGYPGEMGSVLQLADE